MVALDCRDVPVPSIAESLSRCFGCVLAVMPTLPPLVMASIEGRAVGKEWILKMGIDNELRLLLSSSGAKITRFKSAAGRQIKVSS